MAGVAACGHRICKDKKGRFIAARVGKPLLEQRELVFEHSQGSLPADVSSAAAVDGVAELHVVSRDGFGDRSGCAAGEKKPTSDLLPRAYLGKGAVFRAIEIDLEHLLF